MKALSAYRISFSWGCELVPMPAVVVMMIEHTPYIMLTVKRNVMAAKFAVALEKEYGATNVIIGLAFDFNACFQYSKLVLWNDHTLNGIYVRYDQFNGDIKQMQNQ